MRILTTALAGLLSLALVAGCSTAGDGPRQDPAARALDVARTGLTIAKMGAGIYSGLAPCDDAHKPPLCRSEAVVTEIDKALAAAAIALDGADQVLAAAGSDAAAKAKALAIAQAAITAALGILSRYGLAG